MRLAPIRAQLIGDGNLRREDSKLGVEAIRRLKAPDDYPVPSESYVEAFLSRPENVFIVAVEGTEPLGSHWPTCSIASIAINR